MHFQIDQGLLHPARQQPSPHCDARPPDTVISLIVVHGISLPPGRFGGPYIDRLFTGTLDERDAQVHPVLGPLRGSKVCAHLLVRRNGDVTQYAPLHRRAWHAGESSFQGRPNCNDFSIGIELEGCDRIPYHDRQYPVLAQLCQCLMAHYPAILPEHVIGHSDIAPGRKTDPGPAFDWARLHRLLRLLPPRSRADLSGEL